MPEISTKDTTVSQIADEPSVSILPGQAAPELDWDDEEEATSVFDRSEHELLDNLASKRASREKGVSRAAALLASSGGSAKPVKSAPPSKQPAQDSLPRIPAPAPIPRDISHSSVPASAPERHPSIAPHDSRPPAAGGSNTGIIVAAVALIAVLIGGFLYLRGSSDAPVEISVTRAGKVLSNDVQVSIYVDGQKKCDYLPCKLELKPGKKQVRVVSGGESGSQQIDVEGGKNYSFSIPLAGATDATPAVSSAPAVASSAPEPSGPATAKVSTASKDEIKVFVDGKQVGVMKAGSPLELKDLKPGAVKLRFEGSGDFGVVEKEVTVKAGEALDVGEIKLPLLKVKTSFELSPKNATVKLVKKKDGKKSSSTLRFRGGKVSQTLDTSYSWTIIATAKGYQDLEQAISFDDGKSETTIKIELSKEEAVATAPPTNPQPAQTGGPRPTTTPPRPPPPPPPPPAGGKGTINANSIPPSKVIIDGRPRGSTPVTGVKVSAGSHTVIFRHKTLGTKSRTVTVAAGQTKTAAVRFKK